LVLGGLAEGEATRSQWHQQAVQAGMAVTRQGLDQRFEATACDFMKALLQAALTEMVESERTAVPLPQFSGVYVTDCTRLDWGVMGIKLGVRFELQRGRLEACVMNLATNDQTASVVDAPLASGALHLGDLGFFKLDRFRQWSSDGVYWLTRYKVGTHLFMPDGQRVDFKQLMQARHPVCMAVRIGSGNKAVEAFLHAAPLPETALEKRMTRLKEQARLDQQPLSARQQALAPWTVYLTNIPDLTFEQAHTLNRTRWQIELLFKLWKSHGKVLRSRSADPFRRVCEGYGKLIGLIVSHWSLLVAGWEYEKVAALDALRIVRTYLPLLQRALTAFDQFPDFFAALAHALLHASPRPKRRKTPLACQLWRDFEASHA
jgi:hypothetical protein